MSFQEKSTWIITSVMVLVYVWYFTTVLGQIGSEGVTTIGYRAMMLVTVAAFVLLVAAAHIVVALANPRDAESSDERDKEINRYGEFVGGYALGTGALVALALAMLEFDHFWIANTILAALVLSEVVTGATKIVLYRRGI